MQRKESDRPTSAGQISTLLRDVLSARASAAEKAQKAQELAMRSREMTQFLTGLFLHEAGDNPLSSSHQRSFPARPGCTRSSLGNG